MHAIARDDNALSALSEYAARQVEQSLKATELSDEEKEIIYAQRGAGHFRPEVSEVRLGYFGEEKIEPGLHFTVSVIDHPLSPHDQREIPYSFSPSEITEIIEEIQRPES